MTVLADLAPLWVRLWTEPPYTMILAGTAGIALLCGVLSVLVVLKRMAFIGQGISHAAFGGAGIALVLGLYVPALRPMVGRDAVIAAFCVMTALAIGGLARRGRLTEDASIGICLAGAMALGMVLINVRDILLRQMAEGGQAPGREVMRRVSLPDLLFGDVLLAFAGWGDVAVVWVLAVAVVLLTVFLYKEIVFFAFDEEAATVFGVPGPAIYYGTLVVLGLAIVAAMRTMGVILATALLVLPGATARCWSRRIGVVFWISTAAAVVGSMGGLFVAAVLSEYADVSVGPMIVLTLFALFAVSYLFRAVGERRGRHDGG